MTSAVAAHRGLRCRGVGYDFDVVSEIPDLASRVASACRDLAVPDGSGAGRAPVTYRFTVAEVPGRVDLWADDEPVSRGVEGWHAIGMLLWHVNQRVAAVASHTHTVVHAAAAAVNGRAILLPAPMESGKTTTVAGLILDGFDYLTDEAAAIHPDDLHVEPYPKSLSVDRGSWEVLASLAPFDAAGMPEQWAIPVSSIPAPAGGVAQRAPVEWIVFPHYERGAETRLEPISRADAVLQLTKSTFHFVDAPERHLRSAAEAARGATTCLRLTMGSLREAVNLIHGLVTDSLTEVGRAAPG
jgi:hypothetical protein